MDFFEQQERARRSSRRLVFWYGLAVLAVIASYCAVAGAVYAFIALVSGATPVRVPLQVYFAVGGIVAAFILAVSAYRMWQLSDGGPAIAHLLGARHVEPGRCTASTTLDCPVPPLLAAQDPKALAA